MLPALPTHADSSLFAASSPAAHPLHFLVLELVFLTTSALTARHAVLKYKEGERHHLFQWLAIVSYGFMMEYIALNFYQNYVHAQFTIELYHRLLPIYIMFVYPSFLYTGLKIAERLGLAAWPEALVAGFAMFLLDLLFDIIGVDAGWWTWAVGDTTVSARWLGVPVTSYHWYMLFGAVLSLLLRAARAWADRGAFIVRALAAPAVGAAVIALGVLAFIPFNALKALRVPDGAMVLAHLGLCAGVALGAARDVKARAPRAIVVAIPAMLYGWHVFVLALLWSRGAVADAGFKLGAVMLGAFGLAMLVVFLPKRAISRTNGGEACEGARFV